MGCTISIVFHPYGDPKEHFIKTLGLFEVANIIPHLDYIITGPDIDPQILVDSGREDDVKFVHLNERDNWIMETQSDDWEALFSGNDEYSANIGPVFPFFKGVMMRCLCINIVIGNEDIEALYKVKDRIHILEQRFNLFSAEVSSHDEIHIGYKHLHAYAMGNDTPCNLPYLAVGRHFKSGLIPGMVNWINYWSNETLEAIGFDGAVDKELFYDATRMSKGWYLQLTKDPFNFENPEHIEILKRVYNRFKKIGGQDLIEQGLVPWD